MICFDYFSHFSSPKALSEARRGLLRAYAFFVHAGGDYLVYCGYCLYSSVVCDAYVFFFFVFTPAATTKVAADVAAAAATVLCELCH